MGDKHVCKLYTNSVCLSTTTKMETTRIFEIISKKLTYEGTVVLIHATKAYRGIRGIAPLTLNLGSERR